MVGERKTKSKLPSSNHPEGKKFDDMTSSLYLCISRRKEK
jgi:hypothetical protein